MINKSKLPIKTNKRVVLSFWQTIGHYSFMIVPLMFALFELFYKLSGKTAVNTFSITTHVIFVLVSLIIGFVKWRDLSYYKIEATRTDQEFENTVLAAANKLNWSIISLNKNQADVRGFNPWKSRDAQIIKIKRYPDKVIINSMIEPGFLSTPDFLGVNKTNRNTFLNYYDNSNKVENINEKVTQHLKDEEEKLENESEWSLTNTLKRIIAYLFSFGFLGLGFLIWKMEGFNFLALFLCLLGLSYIIFDICVMWAKRNKTNS